MASATRGDDHDGAFLQRLRQELLQDHGQVSTSALGRLWQTGRSMGSVLLGGGDLDDEALAKLVGRLGQLKGVAMKAGQMLGYLDQSVPPELRQALALLQTAAPTTPFERIGALLRDSLGHERAAVLLAGLDPSPVASASIGQVHRGRLPDGTAVAVKVRHPDVEQALAADFRAAGAGALLARALGAGTVTGFIDEARTAFLEECDYGLEAARQVRLRAALADDPVIRIPEVQGAWCSRDVLVTRWQSGQGLDAFLAAGPTQEQRDRAGEALFRFWMRTLYREGLFHGDPHPGNFAFTEDGGIVIYDFGCVRELSPGLRAGFASLAAATRRDDLAAMGAALEALGGRPPRKPAERQQLRRLLRGFFGPLLEPGRRRIAPDAGHDARQLLRDKRALIGLQLPGSMLFLLRLRFGLYAVLARLQAEVDWASLEARWAAGDPSARSPMAPTK